MGAILLSEGFPPETASGIILYQDRHGRLVLNGDTTASGPVYGALRDITLFGGTRADAAAGDFSLDPNDRVTFTWTSQYVDPDNNAYTNELFHLRGLERLAFTAVAATVDPYMHFSGASPVLELRNADVLFTNSVFVESAPGGAFTIHAAAGENRLSELELVLGQIDLRIQVDSGASLLFDQIGNLRGGNRAAALSQDPTSQSLVAIDGGELAFRYANVIFDHGQTVISQGGRLRLLGTGTRVELDRISLQEGQIFLGEGNPRLVATLLVFEGEDTAMRELRFVATPTAEIDEVHFLADGVIAGNEVLSNTLLSTQILSLEQGVTAHFEGAQRVDAGLVRVNTGGVLDIRNGSSLHFNNLIAARHGEAPAVLQVGRLGAIWQEGNFDGAYRVDLNIEAGGEYTVSEGYALDISRAGMHVDIAHGGLLRSQGVLIVSSDVMGDGTITADPFSTFSIGSSREFATVRIAPELRLETLTNFEIDLGVRDGVAVNDVLVYADNPVSMQNSVQYLLFNPLGNSAQDFDNRQFTIIRSESAASLGGINYAPGLAEIVLDPSMPAGLVYRVTDLSTNGRSDLTIETDIDLQAIAHHTGTRNHRDFVQAIVDGGTATPSATLPDGTSLGAALAGLSIGDIHSVRGAHLEGYASAQTIAVQRQELLSDLLLGRLATRCESGPGRWIDASAGRGSVDARDSLGGYRYRMSQIAFGQDFHCGESGGAGVYLNYGTSGTDLHDIVSHDLVSRSIGVGIYGTRAFGQGWHLSGMVGNGLGLEESRRLAPAVGAFTGGIAHADLTTWHAQAGVRLERSFELARSGWSISPSLSTLYAMAQMQGERETGGGDFNFQLDRVTTHSVVIEPGLRLSFQGETRRGRDYAFLAEIKGSHDFEADRRSEHQVGATHELFGDLSQIGLNRGADGAELGLSADMALSDRVSMSGRVRAGQHSAGEEQALSVSLTARW